MLPRLNILVALCAAGVSLAVTTLEPALSLEQRWGFVDKNGKMAISAEFVEAREFSDGLAAVKTSLNGQERWGFIDTSGNVVIKPRFKEVGDFSEGLSVAQLAEDDPNLKQYGSSNPVGKWGWIDKDGEFIIQPKFADKGGPFSDGLAAVSENGKFGYIDKSGKWVIEPQFDLGCQFVDSRAAVLVNEKKGYLSLRTTGEIYRAEGGHWNYIDKEGNIIFGAFNECGIFGNGLAPVAVGRSQGVSRPDKWGFVNIKGRFVIPPRYQDVHAVSEDKAAVQFGSWQKMGKGVRSWKPGKWGYINKKGRKVIDCRFDKADPFSEGMASVEVDGKWGYIDETGKMAIKPKYLGSWRFKNGLAPVLVEIDD